MNPDSILPFKPNSQLTPYLLKARADNTRRAYASDWRHFSSWCSGQNRTPLPASPETVALYLSHLASFSKNSTITRRLSAISQAHQISGVGSPVHDAGVRLVLGGIRRSKGTAETAKRPILLDELRVMTAQASCRDRALLLIGFAGALRRSELVALDWEDIDEAPEGLVVNIRRSKTDPEGQGRRIGIPYGRQAVTCPVSALEAWRRLLPERAGPVFRPLDRWGRILSKRLSDKAVALIIKRLAESAGLDPSAYAGHSLRSGLATAAAQAGASERDIMNQTGHRSLPVLRRYIRQGSLFRDNAALLAGL